MPSKQSELGSDAAELLEESRQARNLSSRLRSALKTQWAAIEQVFTATHGRRMTKSERRRFEEIRKKKELIG